MVFNHKQLILNKEIAFSYKQVLNMSKSLDVLKEWYSDMKKTSDESQLEVKDNEIVESRY